MFAQAITGRSYREIGIAATVDGSFTVREADTIAGVQTTYRARWQASREHLDGLRPDDVVDGRGAVGSSTMVRRLTHRSTPCPSPATPTT